MADGVNWATKLSIGLSLCFALAIACGEKARASVCLWFVDGMGVVMILAVFVLHNIIAIDYVINLFWVSRLGVKKLRFRPRPADAPLMD